ncbi:hypothetical protein MKX03_013023, partial [Papaver bracteatum]
MSCFPCFGSNEKRAAKRKTSPQCSPQFDDKEVRHHATSVPLPQPPEENNRTPKTQNETKQQSEATCKEGNGNIAAQTYTFRELATATKNFRQECLLGEGGFGRVYMGRLENGGQ